MSTAWVDVTYFSAGGPAGSGYTVGAIASEHTQDAVRVLADYHSRGKELAQIGRDLAAFIDAYDVKTVVVDAGDGQYHRLMRATDCPRVLWLRGQS